MKLVVDVEYDFANISLWTDGPADYAQYLSRAIAVIPEVIEFLSSGETVVPESLRYYGWGWIPPQPDEYDDPDWKSPGLEWAFGPGVVQVLR